MGQQPRWLRQASIAIRTILMAAASAATASGEPDGSLFESAATPVRAALVVTPEQDAQAIDYVTGLFHRLGLPRLQGPMAIERNLRTYCAADDAGRLRLHLSCRLVRQSPLNDQFTPYEALVDWRRRFTRAAMYAPIARKLFLDGVAPSLTASFLDPYLPGSAQLRSDAYDADAILQLSWSSRKVTELDRLGFTVRCAVGDRAVLSGLDAIEAARRANGMNGLRHEIAHTPFVHAKRHAALPHARRHRRSLTETLVPERHHARARSRFSKAERTPALCIRSAASCGPAPNCFYGSDWRQRRKMSIHGSALQNMLTRRHPAGDSGAVGPHEAITLDEGLVALRPTRPAPWGVRARRACCQPGSADFIVLDRDLYEIAPEYCRNARRLDGLRRRDGLRRKL